MKENYQTEFRLHSRIMVYFIIYLAIIFFINLVFMGLFHFGDRSNAFNITTVKQIFYAVYVAIPIIIYLSFRLRTKVLPYLKSKQLSFGKLLWTFALMLVVLAGERLTYPLIKRVLKPVENWQYLFGYYRMLQRDFQFYFPIIIVISFLLLFLLYRKKNYV